RISSPGPPSNTSMEAWKHISHISLLNFTAEEITKMGHSLNSVQFPAEASGGYVAQFEAVHQIHCLNTLWEDHQVQKYPERFSEYLAVTAQFPEAVEEHYEHCVDMLRQKLMCNPDMNFVTWDWVEGIDGPWANFNTPHVCQDYDALLEW
ncbi:hypothetical protein BO71DRAFT_283100, partial [Aspergillus ellipticus CBS 707.79]